MKWVRQLAVAGALSAILAGGVGVGQAAAADRNGPSIGVGIQQSAAGADGTLTYTVTAINTGDAGVKRVNITVPFDTAALQPVNAALQSDAGWVNTTAGAVAIQTGGLGSQGDSVQAILRFQALPGHAGASLSQRATYTWSATNDHGSGVSNLPLSTQASVAVQAEGRDLVFDSSAFGSGEGITFWYNAPGSRVVATRIRDGYLFDADVLAAQKARHVEKGNHGEYDDGVDHMFADSQGAVSVRLSTAGLAPGAYTLVARGNTSGLIAVGSFDVK
jgi:hypothetical protein